MKSIALTILLACPMMALAADEAITCDPPQGTRIDFFSYNKINLQNNTFLMGKDQVQGMRPKLLLHPDKTLSFIIGDATETTANPKTGNMQILVYNTDQISFVGMINDAPVLGTYYPKNAVLIYSQQSIWPGPDYQGARAVIFYAKCGANTAQQNEPTVPSMGTVPTANQPATPTGTPGMQPMQNMPVQPTPGTATPTPGAVQPTPGGMVQPAPGSTNQPAPGSATTPMPTTPSPTSPAPISPNAISY